MNNDGLQSVMHAPASPASSGSGGPVDISVIIPMYNVEEYLAECLDSLVSQTKDNIEIIVVDDGSTDSSPQIAKSYAERYGNISYYREENQGVSHARNWGVSLAKGKYLAFADADDVVIEDAYEKMFRLAEQNGSELTICRTARFSNRYDKPDGALAQVFNSIEPVTHITRHHPLLIDTISCDKLILRDFYLRNSFRYPEDTTYFEDIPVMIPMHYLANSVSVLTEVGYLWRLREGATKSATQHIADLDVLDARFVAIRRLEEFFTQHNDTEMLQAQRLKTLQVDLIIFINQCNTIPREDAQTTLRLIRDYLNSSIDKQLFEQLTVMNQQKYACVLNDDLDGLVALLNYGYKGYNAAPVIERGGSLLLDLPDDLFTVASRDYLPDVVRYEPVVRIDDMLIKGGKISIDGTLYHPRINIPSADDLELDVSLYDEVQGINIPLEVTRPPATKLTADKGYVFDSYTGKDAAYNYDGAGFHIEIVPKRLEVGEGNYQILIKHKTRFCSGRVMLKNASSAIRNRIENVSTLMGNGLVMSARFGRLQELHLHVDRIGCMARDMQLERDRIVITTKHPVDTLSASGADRRMPFAQMSATSWSIAPSALKPGELYSLTSGDASTESPVLIKEKTVRIEDAASYAAVMISRKTYQIRLKLHDWLIYTNAIQHDGLHVTLALQTAGAAPHVKPRSTMTLCIDDAYTAQQTVLATARTSTFGASFNVRFSIDFSDESLTSNLYEGARDIYVSGELKGGKPFKTPLYSKENFSTTMVHENLSIRLYRGVDGSMRVRCKNLWSGEESTAAKRRALIARCYPEYRQDAIDTHMILFEDQEGASFGGNARALYEHITLHHPEYACVWALKDPRIPITGPAVKVRRGSCEYYYCLATAKYLIHDGNFPADYIKRPQQIDVQTMHGTPLKTMGLDIAQEITSETIRDALIDTCSNWDYLCVQGDHMRSKAYSCYRFEGKLLQTGYPRTDALFNPDGKRVAELKQRLGLPMDKKLVLYAPTYRTENSFAMRLDTDNLRENIGDGYALVVHLHPLCGTHYDIKGNDGFVFDRTSYAAIEDLYLVSDMLITDYSSAMFDYALLDKPMVFYLYDYQSYSSRIRGLYADIREEAPGPVAYDMQQLVEAITRASKGIDPYKEKLTIFKSKYLTYEQAGSCGQVFREVFENAGQ